MYLSGLEVPASMLAIEASGRTQLFVPDRDARFESASRTNDFPGRKLGLDPELERRSGIACRPYAELEHALFTWIQGGTTIWLDLGRGAAKGPAGHAQVVLEIVTRIVLVDRGAGVLEHRRRRTGRSRRACRGRAVARRRGGRPPRRGPFGSMAPCRASPPG